MSNDKIIVNSTGENYELEIFHLTRLFYANSIVTVNHTQSIEGNIVTDIVEVILQDKTKSLTATNTIKSDDEIIRKRLLKRFTKQIVYKALSLISGKTLPYGCLTGVRPTKVAYDLLDEGVDITILKETLMKEFYLSGKKANLVYETIKNQKSIIKNDHLVDLYVNIPICPSRCNYCSFISSDIKAAHKILPEYLYSLIEEIRQTKKLIQSKSYVIRTIYVGGGTPTILSAEQLDRLLTELSYPVSEFTVEAGRADTITEEKLIVMKKHGVNRICINPQTFVVKSLKNIGRLHTNEQVYNAYMLALKHDFIINMDFIAGLEGESLTNFKKTISTALELSPHNITIHTLFLKNNSCLGGKDELLESNDALVEKMIDYAYDNLTAKGYKPYYLYRQKNQLEGLENVGYAMGGKVCLFNIDSMEETLSIIACGANGISKRVYGKNKPVERYANAKLISDYINKIDEIILNKKELFK